jgi:hypothetical protein
MIAFHIGSREADSVCVSITDDRDDGWLLADVEVAAGRFRGKYTSYFDTQAFLSFSKQLEIMHKTVSGSAKFTSLEGQLELALECDALGHVSVTGQAMDQAGIGNKLVFEFDIDQTHLPEILGSLKGMLAKHPVRPF